MPENRSWSVSASFFVCRLEGAKKDVGLASNLSRLDLIPTTRSKLLKQMGIWRSIRNDYLRHLRNFLSPLPVRTKQDFTLQFIHFVVGIDKFNNGIHKGCCCFFTVLIST